MHSMQQMEQITEKEKELSIRYGSTASEAMFDFPCKFFQIPQCSGIIAYRVEYNCAIVLGDPICPENEISQLTEAFHRFCQESNLNVIYVIVSEKFARWARQSHCNILIEVCEELIINPEEDPCLESSRMRHKVSRAIKKGLTVHEYIPFNEEIENALKEVGVKWEKAIKGWHMYLGHLNFFENYTGKRWFYVKDKDRIISMLMLSKLDAYDGWLLKFLATLPDAYHDTSEFLMTSVLEILRKENCRFLTKGMVPLDYLGEISGLGSISSKISRGIYQVISWIFQFKKRKEYWLRYNPKVQPSYLLLSRPHIGFNEIRALMNVFRTHHN